MKPFEKILERLEERTDFLSDCTKYGNKDAEQQEKSYSTMMLYEVADLVEDLKAIVQKVAEEYKITNGDKIRYMNDEELAEFLVNFKNTYGDEYEGEMSCLDWLKSEVKN